MFLCPICPLRKAKNVTKIFEGIEKNWNILWSRKPQFLKANTFWNIDLFTYYFFYTVMNKCFNPLAVIWTVSLVMSCINFNMVLRKRGTRGHNLTPGRFILTSNWKTLWCIWLLPDSGGFRGKKGQVLIII